MADTQTIHAIGRRKEAVCRVYVKPGSGKWDVNGRTLGDYFPRPALVTAIQQPFTATDTLGRYDVKANVDGGGSTGPAGSTYRSSPRTLPEPLTGADHSVVSGGDGGGRLKPTQRVTHDMSETQPTV